VRTGESSPREVTLAFVARKLFTHSLSIQLEAVKASYNRELSQMRQDHEAELEKLRNELAVIREKTLIKYSRLHEEQAQVTKDIYDCVVRASVATRMYLEAIKDNEKPNAAQNLEPIGLELERELNALTTRFVAGRIFFDGDLDQLVMEVVKSTRSDVKSFEDLAKTKMNAPILEAIGLLATTLNPRLSSANLGQVDLDAELTNIYDKLGALQERLVHYFRKTLGSVPAS
jgi:hypothetical protein